MTMKTRKHDSMSILRAALALCVFAAAPAHGQQIFLNISTLGGYLFHPSKLVTTLHEVPRPNYKALNMLNGEPYLVKDNAFEPKDTHYLASLAAGGLYFAVPLFFLLLIYWLYLCCRCFKVSRCAYFADDCCCPPSCNQGVLVLLWLAALAIVGCAYFPREEFASSLADVNDVMKSMDSTFSNLSTSTQKMSSAAASMATTFTNADCTDAVNSTVAPGLEAFKDVAAEQEKLFKDMDPKIHKLRKKLDGAGMYVDIYLGSLIALIFVSFALVVCGVCSDSVLALDIATCIGNFTYIIFVIAVVIQFVFTLMTADFCMNPDGSMLYLVENFLCGGDTSTCTNYNYASYYVTCSAGHVNPNPFYPQLNQTKQFLSYIQSSSTLLQAQCSDQISVAHLVADAQQAELSLQPIHEDVACGVIAPSYIKTAHSMCNHVENGMSYCWMIQAGCAVVLYIIFYHTSCIRATFEPAEETEDKDDQEAKPLLSTTTKETHTSAHHQQNIEQEAGDVEQGDSKLIAPA